VLNSLWAQLKSKNALEAGAAIKDLFELPDGKNRKVKIYPKIVDKVFAEIENTNEQ
jgi:hypothetical protein